MQITKKLWEEIKPGEIFKVVTTRFQEFHEPLKETLKFVCIRSQDTFSSSWAIYCQRPHMSDQYIADHGDKVHFEDIILSICPCDPEVLKMYRH